MLKHNQTQTHTHKHKQTQHKHRQTQTNTDTSSPISSTRRPISFQVARGLHSFLIRTSSAKQGMSQSTGTLTLWQVRAVCAQREREPDWTSDHCHCCWERRETTRAGRETRKREEKERKREKRPPLPSPSPPPHHHHLSFSLLPVCMLKTSPCVGSKRIRACRQNARICSTCAPFAGTHGCVLNLHTETSNESRACRQDARMCSTCAPLPVRMGAF